MNVTKLSPTLLPEHGHRWIPIRRDGGDAHGAEGPLPMGGVLSSTSHRDAVWGLNNLHGPQSTLMTSPVVLGQRVPYSPRKEAGGHEAMSLPKRRSLSQKPFPDPLGVRAVG